MSNPLGHGIVPDAGDHTRRIGAYLSAHLPEAGDLRSCRKLEGGQSNPTYLLETAHTLCVLRSKPAGRLLKSAHAIDREFQVLTALQGTDVPVPRPYLYCNDSSVLGSEFYVMEHVAGRTFWNPAVPEVDQSQRTRIHDSMNDVLVALARVNLRSVGLMEYGRREGFFERQVRRWTEQYRAAETSRRDHMEALIDWLPGNVPVDDGRASLMHGDFRLDNLLIDDRGQVAAVLDWELSTIGHPLCDLAYQCAQWRLPAGRMRGLDGIDREAIGIPSEARYVQRFCERIGMTQASGWTFLLVLSLFRLASICQGIYRRGLDGNASSANALDFDERTTVIAAHAVAIVDAVASDDPTLRIGP